MLSLPRWLLSDEAEISPRYKRISKRLYNVAIDPSTPQLTPTKLRPKCNDECEEDFQNPRLTGNLILDVGTTEKYFNLHIRQHLSVSPHCDGDIVFDPPTYRKWGAAVKCAFKCTGKCGYRSPQLDFFETVDLNRRKAGRKTAKINVQIQVGLTKQPICNSGLRQLFLACDLNPPCMSGLQKTSNKVADTFVDLNEGQLRENRKLVNEVMTLRHGSKVGIVAQTDTAFNNAPKGRAFYQPGTQAWCPVFCAEPGLNLPIAFKTRSKLCSCRAKSHKDDCKRDYPVEQPMGNVEFQFGQTCGKEVLSDSAPEASICVKELITDGDSHAFKGFAQSMESNKKKPCVRGRCTRHLTKGIGRNVNKATLRSVEGNTKQEMTQNRRALAKFLEKRSSWEFRKAHEKFGNNPSKMKSTCAALKKGILRCIQGDAEGCRKVSLVCAAHKKKGQTKVCPSLYYIM